MQDISVVHRNGVVSGLDITRIRNVINWACKNFNDCDSTVLESVAVIRFKDGISTQQIQSELIQGALELAIEEPDWRYVAGRLFIWNSRRNIEVQRGFGYGDLAKTVKYLVNKSVYDPQILNYYSEDELYHAGLHIQPLRDKDYDYAGALKLSNRYCAEGELPQETFMMCALWLAHEEPDKLSQAKKFYDLLSLRKISLATPFLMNLRKTRTNLASCFIIGVEDSIDSIFSSLNNAAQVSKYGGGVGVYLGNIRASRSWVRGNKNASGGVLPWAKLFNDVAVAVDQGGKRSGAITLALDIWHLDIGDFLECQTENGDVRRKCYDIFTQVCIPDLFMERVRGSGVWYTVDPYEVKTKLGIDLPKCWGEEFERNYLLIEKYIENGTLTLFNRYENARDLMKKIIKTYAETGLPYLFFKDAVNEANPNKHEGIIPSSNLCTESYSVFEPHKYAHTCNLASLNLANITVEELPSVCESAVRILDNSIELSKPPIKESANHNTRFRTVGLGVMGLADFLAVHNKQYEDKVYISNLFEDIAYYATKTSVDLAKERGVYPAFTGSEWDKGKLLGSKTINQIKTKSYNLGRWIKLRNLISTFGIRNSQIMAIAPNTSSSLLQGCTASILPPFALEFFDKHKEQQVPVAVPYIKTHRWNYKPSSRVDQNVVVDAVAAIQFWVDTGISMELLFNLDEGAYLPGQKVDAKSIYDVIINAWQQNLKTIYYVRTKQSDKVKCESCAN